MANEIEDVLKKIQKDPVQDDHIKSLLQSGVHLPYFSKQPCEHFVRRNVLLSSIYTLFEFWEKQIRYAGITLPKSARQKWNDILYAESSTQGSKGFKFGNIPYGWFNIETRESVQTVYITTILTRSDPGTVSGTLIVCQKEYIYEPLIVMVTEPRSAFWGLFNWNVMLERRIPRKMDSSSVKILREILRSDAVKHIEGLLRFDQMTQLVILLPFLLLMFGLFSLYGIFFI
ncbi:uncharacterized protein LOC134266365 [Saccostrea cucullata]|uniref:uncharacterized protein LOC134266365 n=1 Tax=Saccostrea cuccullata TaxID=36930 RepID=UPI002ED16AF8